MNQPGNSNAGNGDIYTPPEADLHTDSGAPVYAGFWIRVLAALIDSIWLLLLTFSLGWMIYGAYYIESEALLLGWADFLISYVLPFALTMLFWFYRSATPGKMVVGAKIVDARTLEPASKGRLVLRYIGYYIAMLPLFLGILWVAWDPRKQGWHDKIAGTVVIRSR